MAVSLKRRADSAFVVAAFTVALVLGALTLAEFGEGRPGTVAALRVTARWSFLVFWLAYVGRPIAVLFGAALLAQRARALGLAFAAAQTVHLSLVAWLYHISVRPPVSPKTLILFGVGTFFTYFLAVLSFQSVSRRLARVVVHATRTAGIHYIAFVFLFDFAKGSFRGDVINNVIYLPFLALAAAGPALHGAAWILLRKEGSKKAVLF